MALTPGTRVGRYEVVSRLGAGGMGEVYLATDAERIRLVALKILHETHPDSLKRFEREARAASALNHPNIPVVYEFGFQGKLHFIAIELVEGVTLRQKMRAGPLPLADVLDVALQAATALGAAHEGGLVHRDVKPENLMVRPDGVVKVLDFGLARFARRGGTSTGATSSMVTIPGMIMGTAAYMSPEQVRGETLDGRTDIWSLGLVAYEMVAGRSPFKLPTQIETLAAILQRDPPPLETTATVPEELVRIVTRSLAKARELRYQSARELAIDLRRLTQRLAIDGHLARSGGTLPPPGINPDAGAARTRTHPPAPAPSTAIEDGSDRALPASAPRPPQADDAQEPPQPARPRRRNIGTWSAGAAVAVVIGIIAAIIWSRGCNQPGIERTLRQTASPSAAERP